MVIHFTLTGITQLQPNKRQIIEYVQENGIFPPYNKWKKSLPYQSFVLGDETIRGKRDCPERLDQLGLLDLSGKNVLDIGCNIGGIANECSRRGASTVVGVDAFSQYIRCAKKIAQYNKLSANFLTLNVNHPKTFIRKLRNKFSLNYDIVFCFALIGGPPSHWVAPQQLSFILNKIPFKSAYFEFADKVKEKAQKNARLFVDKYKVKHTSVREVGAACDDDWRFLWEVRKS